MIVHPKEESPVMCPRCGGQTMVQISAKHGVWACKPCLWVVPSYSLFTPANFIKVLTFAKKEIAALPDASSITEPVTAALEELTEKMTALCDNANTETEIETDPESWLS